MPAFRRASCRSAEDGDGNASEPDGCVITQSYDSMMPLSSSAAAVITEASVTDDGIATHRVSDNNTLKVQRSGDPDCPVAHPGYDVDRPAEGFDVAADSIHLGHLAVLDLRHPGLRYAHHGRDLSLGQPGVLPQLRELIAALL